MATSQARAPVVLEPLLRKHWPAVKAIYEEGLATGQASFETEAPDWSHWDSAHLPHSRLVAIRRDEVMGWAALTPVSRRAAYSGVAEVSVYVTGVSRGQGIGRCLLEALIRESETAGIWTLVASIFPENMASTCLHENCGFRLLGRRERIARRQGVWRDTVLYERRSAVSGL